MKVWELNSSEKSMAIRSLNNKYSYFVNEHFNGQSMKEWWKPIEMEVYKKGTYKDFPYYAYVAPVFTPASFELLDPLIHDHVEYLDVYIMEGTVKLQLVNVLTRLNALVHDKSKMSRSRSGIITYVDMFYFNEDMIRDVPIFKIPETGRVFVSDEFRNLVLNSKLKGFEFIEVWDSEFTVEQEQEQKNRYAAKLVEIERTKGPEFDWAEAYKRIELGHAVRSSKWKLQMDKQGNLLIGHLSEEDCSYFWTDPIYIPPILLDLKWHDTEKSDI